MATTTSPSSSLTRYPRWALLLTGLTAAYATYTVWSSWDSTSSSPASGLHRRGAIRQSRRRSPHNVQQLSANMQASAQQPSSGDEFSSPFGAITAQVNNREAIYQIGPNPPTLQQLEDDFNLTGATLLRIHTDMQHVLLDLVVDRLLEPNAEELLNSCAPAYSSLIPLIEPLRDRNIGDLLGFIHLLAGRARDDVEADAEGEWRFEQANVALAFARRCGVDVARGGGNSPINADAVDGDPAETIIESDAGGQTREPGQGIKGLLYTIAEEQAKRVAYIHRGTRCDSCGEFPIRGVRWHCINCPDYDLCSNCESQAPSVHPRTHVFAKIKIPISTLAQPHQVHDLWYPGDPQRHWAPLKVSLRKRLVSETGFEDVALEAYYEQFTCIANVAYPDDPAEIRAAIDRRAFNKAMSSDKWPAPLEPNFLFDRMFTFYDTDNNSLIGFEEFVHGLSYLRHPPGYSYASGKQKSMDRVLKGYDVDGDGLLSRADFVRMFSAKYAVQKHIIRDVVAAEEAEIVAHTMDVVRSSQPISAAFTGEDVPYGERREPGMKRMDRFGDMQVAVDHPLGDAILPDNREVWDGPTVNAVSRRYGRFDDIVRHGSPFTLGHAEEIRQRYHRVEAVPIPASEDGGQASLACPARYLVETDPRANRGRTNLDPAEERWRTDLNDAVAGGASGHMPSVSDDVNPDPHYHGSASTAESNGDQSNGTNQCDDFNRVDHGKESNGEDMFPDFILNRGRAYEVPQGEVDFGSEVLYQVIQEGFNELLDPLFLEREGLSENVRKTRSQRQQWRAEIDKHVQEKRRLRDELETGAETDPLVATALRSSVESGNVAHANQGAQSSMSGASPIASGGRSLGPSSDATSSSQVLLAGTEASNTRPPTESQDIATEIRTQIQQQNAVLPTDDEGLENLEISIREQSLDELLAATGYSVASPIEERPSTEDGLASEGISASASPTPAPVPTLQEENVDPTLPQFRPNDNPPPTWSQNADVLLEEAEDAMHLSPSSPPTPLLPPPTPRLSPDDSGYSGHHHSTHSETHQEDSAQGRDGGYSQINGNGNGSSSSSGSDSSSKPPSPQRLDYFSRLDEEERRILERGGPGRLTFAEVEEICKRQGNGVLLGLVEGWLEWAGF